MTDGAPMMADRSTDTGTPPETMRAVYQGAWGPPEILEVRDLPRPSPGPGEVLVKVQAAALDRGTWHLLRGLPLAVRPVEGLRRPRKVVPGLDLAGVVESVGADVDDLRPGDEVFGTARGTLAEWVVAAPAKLARKPAALTFEAAAAVPVSGQTALHAVREQGQVQAGHHVLVLGASGGVGSYTVQLAKAFGARVTGVCSTAKVDFVRSLGADEVLDYESTDPTDGSTRYDVVLDNGGSRTLRQLRRALTPTGTLVIVGGEGGGRWLGGVDRGVRAMVWSLVLKQRLRMFIAPERRADVEALVPYLESGQVVPAVERVVGLDDVAAELRRMEDGAIRGKVVVTPT